MSLVLGRDLGSHEHVLHKCDVRSCINPAHMYLGTHVDNMRDCANRGRTAGRKLTDEQVAEIKATARHYGYSLWLLRAAR